MLSKIELKYIQSLCQKKQRQKEGLFIVEGPKMVEELFSGEFRIRKLYALPNWMQNREITFEAETITETELERISGLQTPNQVLAIVEQKHLKVDPVYTNQLTLVLDDIQDPGNLGTIIRIADWFGVKQIVASEDTVEMYNPKVIQSTMGSFNRVSFWYKKLTDILQSATVPVYGAVFNGKNVLRETPFTEGLLLIGNEGKGISKELLPFISNPITIPKMGGAESLNAAVATGIILSHVKKA